MFIYCMICRRLSDDDFIRKKTTRLAARPCHGTTAFCVRRLFGAVVLLPGSGFVDGGRLPARLPAAPRVSCAHRHFTTPRKLNDENKSDTAKPMSSRCYEHMIVTLRLTDNFMKFDDENREGDNTATSTIRATTTPTQR